VRRGTPEGDEAEKAEKVAMTSPVRMEMPSEKIAMTSPVQMTMEEESEAKESQDDTYKCVPARRLKCTRYLCLSAG
jgi:hypothetical protein